MKSRLDVVQKEGFQITSFEIAGAVEITGAAPDVHDLEFVEPSGDGGFGERSPELV